MNTQLKPHTKGRCRMASVRELLARKGSSVQVVPPLATVLEATQKMNREKIGAVVVRDGAHVVGIFTERDVLRRVVAAELPPRDTHVADVMTTDVVCAALETDLEEVKSVMMNRRIRHLPVCDDDGQVVGMVSIGDVNAWEAAGAESTIGFLSDYIQGRV